MTQCFRVHEYRIKLGDLFADKHTEHSSRAQAANCGLCFTSSPSQTSCEVVSSAQRKHSNRWTYQQIGFVWWGEQGKKGRKDVRHSSSWCWRSRVPFKAFLSNTLTYRVENPANCSVSPAHQDPVVLQTSEETQSESKTTDSWAGYRGHRSTRDHVAPNDLTQHNLSDRILTPVPAHRLKGCTPAAGSVNTEIYAGLWNTQNQAEQGARTEICFCTNFFFRLTSLPACLHF